MAEGRIQMRATLDSVAAKKNGIVVQLMPDDYTTPEDFAELCRMARQAGGGGDRGPRAAPAARVRGRRRRDRPLRGGLAMRLDVKPFRADCTDKDAAMKVLEEASEAREAWQQLDGLLEYHRLLEQEHPEAAALFNLDAEGQDLADELADCITACCNLAERYGIDLQAALDRVERRNRERGRYDD